MSIRLTRRLFLGGFGAASALALTGCYSMPKEPEEKWVFPRFSNVGSRVRPATPAYAKPVTVSTLDALSGDGIFFFHDDCGAQFRLKGRTKRADTYLIEEKFEKGEEHGFTWGSGAVGILKNAKRIAPERPSQLTIAPDGHAVITFKDDKTLELHVRLEAYDVSGLPVREFLRTSANMPTTAALFIGAECFPEGSIAYAATLWVDKDEILSPSATAFTGSETLEDFSKRYMKETPMCMRSLPGRDVESIGVLFDRPIRAQKVRRRGRLVEAKQTGKLRVYATKRGTIFCQKAQNDTIGRADWELAWVNGTRTLSIAIPDGLDALSFGMSEANRHSLLPAFSEERKGSGRRQTRQVIPSFLWKKDAPIRDAQYRFNAKAARAIDAAILASQSRREKWESENESEVTKRARAIQAKKAEGRARRL